MSALQKILRIYDINDRLKKIDCNFNDYSTCEQLVDKILKKVGVKLAYRQLFSIRIATATDLWLPPNYPLNALDDIKLELPEGEVQTTLTLDLRLRFRPSSLETMSERDSTAFSLLHSQIREDFLHSDFSDKNPEFMFARQFTLGLIAADILRHSIESKGKFALKDIVRDKFMPEQAVAWQKSLLFPIDGRYLKKVINSKIAQCENDPRAVVAGFVALFLKEACPDYTYETYNVVLNQEIECTVRARYNLTYKISTCVVEYTQKSPDIANFDRSCWTSLFELEDIETCILALKVVEIISTDGVNIVFEFNSVLHAMSFVSYLDGYNRLTNKWYHNICRSVISPYLERLQAVGSHGPICDLSVHNKLHTIEWQQTYLIRADIRTHNVYRIEIKISKNMGATVEVRHSRKKNYFKIVGVVSTHHLTLTTRMKQRIYRSLPELLYDLTLWRVADPVKNESISMVCALKKCISPEETDECPSLLLSVAPKRLETLIKYPKLNTYKINFPEFIPPYLFTDPKQLLPPINDNQLVVKLMIMQEIGDVIVKRYTDDFVKNNSQSTKEIGVFFNVLNRNYDPGTFGALEPADFKTSDWVMTKHRMLATTIGLHFSANAIIQELFPLGNLACYMSNQKRPASEDFIVELAEQMAQALLYLKNKSILHSKIRCHNFFIYQVRPFKIKLSDPLGTVNPEHDMAFIPPEYRYYPITNGQVTLGIYKQSLDIWAMATTVWQLFNNGSHPKGVLGNCLLPPRLCSDYVWSMIEKCWAICEYQRMSAESLIRGFREYSKCSEPEDEVELKNSCNNFNTKTRQKSKSNISISEATSRTSSESRSKSTGKEAASPLSHQTQPKAGVKYIIKKVFKLEQSLLRSSNSSSNNHTRTKSNNSHAQDRERVQSRSTILPKITVSSLKVDDTDSSSSGESDKSNVEFDEAPSVEERGKSVSSEDKYTRLSLNWATTLTTMKRRSTLSDVEYEAFERSSLALPKKMIRRGFRVGVELARGDNGIVHRGSLVMKGVPEAVVAMKCTNHRSVMDKAQQLTDLKKEYDILSTLKHTNIVVVYGFVLHKYRGLMLVMEYAPLGNLHDLIRELPPSHIANLPLRKFAHDVAYGLAYLHKSNIVHQDVALRNILINGQNTAVVADFGLAQILTSGDSVPIESQKPLPLSWYGPEVFLRSRYHYKTDVWSYGIMLWEMFSGGCTPSYPVENFQELLTWFRTWRLPKPETCSQVMYNFIWNSCWAYEPKDRKTFSKICYDIANLTENDCRYVHTNLSDMVL